MLMIVLNVFVQYHLQTRPLQYWRQYKKTLTISDNTDNMKQHATIWLPILFGIGWYWKHSKILFEIVHILSLILVKHIVTDILRILFQIVYSIVQNCQQYYILKLSSKLLKILLLIFLNIVLYCWLNCWQHLKKNPLI